MESQKQEYVQCLWKSICYKCEKIMCVCVCVHYLQTHFCGLLHELLFNGGEILYILLI